MELLIKGQHCFGEAGFIFSTNAACKVCKVSNWPLGIFLELKASKGLCCFFAKPNLPMFISKYYNYDVDTLNRNSDISMCPVSWVTVIKIEID